MSLVGNCKAEIERSPVTVIATVVGVIVSCLALLIAWVQLAGTPTAAGAVASVPPAQLQISNLLVVLAFFLASSLSFASAVRILARSHAFPALVFSLPAAVLSGFGTMLMLYIIPPKSFGADAMITARDVVFWGTCIVFVAVNGMAVLQDLAKASPNPAKPGNGPDGLAALTISLFLLLGWAGLVSAGLSKMTKAFLE